MWGLRRVGAYTAAQLGVPRSVRIRRGKWATRKALGALVPSPAKLAGLLPFVASSVAVGVGLSIFDIESRVFLTPALVMGMPWAMVVVGCAGLVTRQRDFVVRLERTHRLLPQAATPVTTGWKILICIGSLVVGYHLMERTLLAAAYAVYFLYLGLSVTGVFLLGATVRDWFAKATHSPTELEPEWLTEAPIHRDEQDLLGRSAIVKHVGELIGKGSERGAVVVALEGQAGSGKTSMANLLRQRLLASGATVAYVSGFSFSSAARPVEVIVDSLVVELNRTFATPDLGRELASYFAAVAPLVNRTIGLDMAAILARQADSGARRERLLAALQAVERPVVVIFDDLERLPAPVLVALLAELEALGDLPGFVYVPVLDQRLAEGELRRALEHPSAFLDKVLARVMRLPSLSSSGAKELVLSCWRQALYRHGVETSARAERVVAAHEWAELMPTMRSCVRTLRVFDERIGAVGGGIDAGDLFLASWVEVNQPGAFVTLERHRELWLRPEWSPVSGANGEIVRAEGNRAGDLPLGCREPAVELLLNSLFPVSGPVEEVRLANGAKYDLFRQGVHL